jgi:hypothetical protein
MHPEDRTLGERLWRGGVRLLVTLLIVLLAGAAAVLMAQLNSRTFKLERQDGKLVVMKGRHLPFGYQPFRPSDAALADAYAPVPLERPIDDALLDLSYSERDELDRGLFEVLEAHARPLVASDSPESLEKGLYYLRRAERLAGLTSEQQLTVKKLQAEVAYFQARLKLDDARKMVSEGLAQLKIAADSGNRHSKRAHQMITAVEPHAKALEQALRETVYNLSGPPAKEETGPGPVAPTPPAPPDASSDAGSGTPHG